MEALTGIALLIGGVVGVVEFVKRLVAGDWKTALIILAAGLTGYILAPSAEIGLTAIQGLVAGFSASGYVTLVQNVGKKTSEPTDLVG